MNSPNIEVEWPNGKLTSAQVGDNWLNIATEAGISIPTGCLGGSCGACEIEVNGDVLRACISSVSGKSETHIKVEIGSDPYW